MVEMSPNYSGGLECLLVWLQRKGDRRRIEVTETELWSSSRVHLQHVTAPVRPFAPNTNRLCVQVFVSRTRFRPQTSLDQTSELENTTYEYVIIIANIRCLHTEMIQKEELLEQTFNSPYSTSQLPTRISADSRPGASPNFGSRAWGNASDFAE